MSELSTKQYGAVARWQLRDLGYADDTVRARLRDGAWTALSDEVIVRVGSPTGRGQAVMAATLDAGPGALLSFRSGASWYRLQGPQLLPLAVVTTTHSRRRSTLSRVHVVRQIPPSVRTVLDGVPIARPELLALHLFATEPYGRAERWVEQMWSLRLLDGRSIARFLKMMGARGRNGTAGLRRYLEARPLPYVPSATGVELRARKVLQDAGFNVRAQADSGGESWTGRVDLRDVEVPVILEVQSARYHGALVDREGDAERIAALRRDGFVVVEVTDDVVFHDPSQLVRSYAEAVARASDLPRLRSVVQNQKDPSGSAQQNGIGEQAGPRVAFSP